MDAAGRLREVVRGRERGGDRDVQGRGDVRERHRGLALRGVSSLRYHKRAYLLRQALEGAPSVEARRRLLAEHDADTFEQEYLEDGAAAVA